MYIEPALPLAVTFPLPFRVLFLVGLEILGWATNLHGLQLLGVDGLSVLDFYASNTHLPLRSPSPSGRLSSRAFYTPIYRLFILYTCWCFTAWLAFRAETQSEIDLIDVFRYIPGVCILGVFTVLVCPYDAFHKRERDWFLSAARRCFFLTSDNIIYFSDVLFADVLTSFAKVLGDMWLSLCMLLPGGSLFSLPLQDGWHQWILPTLMSLPYLVRFRQCLIEYRSPTNTDRRPLFNAIKYASSFPVIFLSAAQRLVVSDLEKTHHHSTVQEGWHGEHPLFRLWFMFAIINSLYSFWWDLTNDWGLDLLTSNKSRERSPRAWVHPSRHTNSTSISRTLSPDPSSFDTIPSSSSTRFDAAGRCSSYPYGLRPVLLYPLPVYPIVIFLNFVLRMTWSIKLSSHLYSQSEGSGLIFWLEMAELLRRWVWVFLRIEWEVVKRGKDKARVIGSDITPDGIELPQTQSKGEMFN